MIPGQMVHQRYRVVALLSQGGMGAVFEAMDSTLNIRCALKEMTPFPGAQGRALPALREQFLQEARLLAGLHHPNLPRVSDHFEEDGNAYLVMDFVHGQRLDEVVAQEGELPEAKVLEWAGQLLDALAYCHERGVIHRDVKPQNVIITWEGKAVLVDFGLAKLVDPDDPRTRSVMRGMGTPEYAPPEQYDTKRGHTDARTDIYSLGATLYYAVTGTPPPSVGERLVTSDLVPARQRRPDLSEGTDRAISKAMSLHPANRFQTITELRRALFNTAQPTGTVSLPGLPKAERLPRWAGAVIGLIALVAVAGLLVSRVNREAATVATATPTSTLTASPSPSPSPTATASSTATATGTPAETVTPTSFPTPTWTPTRARPTPTLTPTA